MNEMECNSVELNQIKKRKVLLFSFEKKISMEKCANRLFEIKSQFIINIISH